MSNIKRVKFRHKKTGHLPGALGAYTMCNYSNSAIYSTVKLQL